MTHAKGDVALWRWVTETLRARVESGRYAPGARLPSLLELCAEFGVSDTTLRNALKELTQRGVLETRPRRGIFVCSARARPQAAQARIIAAVTQESSSEFAAPILRAVEDECRARGYHVLITSTHSDIALENRLLLELPQTVAGLLVRPNLSGEYAAYEALLARGVPLVFIDHHVPRLPVSSVATDNVLGGYLATKHLIAQGRKNICFIGQPHASSVEERFAGYQKALREANIPFVSNRVYTVSGKSQRRPYFIARRLLQEHANREPLGVFAANDVFARDCCLAAEKAGLCVPQDVAVVGYDDVIAAFCTPALSSVRQNLQKMGRQAARLLLDSLPETSGTNAAPIQTIRLKPELIVRDSSDEDSGFSLARHIESRARNTR